MLPQGVWHVPPARVDPFAPWRGANGKGWLSVLSSGAATPSERCRHTVTAGDHSQDAEACTNNAPARYTKAGAAAPPIKNAGTREIKVPAATLFLSCDFIPGRLVLLDGSVATLALR